METQKNLKGRKSIGSAWKGSAGIHALQRNFDKLYTNYQSLATEFRAMRKVITTVARKGPVV
jgi:hypothetical protein